MVSKKEIVCYNTDASRLVGKTEKVVFPKNIREVQRVVRSLNVDIVPRGAGSNLVGGCIPDNSIVVDMGKMNKVLNFDPLNKKVQIESGMTIKELNEKLKAVGFEFPVFSSIISTIGGMIALNCLGDRSMKYGRIKDWIEEIEFVNGRGELMKAGKTDLMDVCGMEGITGIIVNATLKIKPLVKKSASIFQTDELEEVLSIVRRLKLEKEVVMLKFFSREVSELLGFPGKYHLFIEFNSERGKIKGEEYDKFLKIINKTYYFLYSKEYYNSEDPKFFFDKVGEFILFLEKNQIPYFGDLGLGIIYPFFKDQEEKSREEVISFIRKIKTKTGKYGFGLKRKDFLDPFELKIIQRVKLRHDPFGKMNKGKIVDVESRAEKLEKKIEEKLDKGIELGKEIREEKEFLVGEEKSATQFLKELESELKIEKSKEEIKDPEKRVERQIEEKQERLLIEKPLEEKPKLIEEPREREIKEFETVEISKKEFEEQKSEIPYPETPDYNKIKDVMTNKFGFEVNKGEFDVQGEVVMEDNLEKEGLDKESGKLSREDQDLINKIMLNKLDDKKEDKTDKKNDN